MIRPRSTIQNYEEVTERPSRPADPARASSIRRRSIRGSFWVLGGYFLSQLLRLGGNLVLSHLVSPTDFGAMALLTCVVLGMQMLSDVGLGQAVVQQRNGDEPAFLNTVFSLQIVKGFAGWIGLSALALPLAWLYDRPNMVPYIPVVAFILAIGGFASSNVFLAQRRLDTRSLIVLELVSQAIGIGATLAYTRVSPNVNALVFGEYVRVIARTVLSHVILPGPRSRLQWDKPIVRAVLKVGKWLTVSSGMTYFAMQTDRLILGKLEHLEKLGVYSMALVLASVPSVIMTRLANSVLLPALAEKARIDPDSLPRTVLSARASLLRPGLFACVAVTVSSPLFFQLLYDERYVAGAWICPMLFPYVWFSILQVTADRALVATGRTRPLAHSWTANFLVTVAGCLVGHEVDGLRGFVIGLGFSSLAGYAIVLVTLWKLGIRVIAQDLRFTAPAMVLGFTGTFGPRLLAEQVPWLGTRASVALLAGAIVLGTGVVLGRKTLAELR